MSNLNFSSFDEMVETLDRGNEIVFELNSERYFVLPNWESNKISGYVIGHAYSDDETVCPSKEALADYLICGTVFARAFGQITIIERTI